MGDICGRLIMLAVIKQRLTTTTLVLNPSILGIANFKFFKLLKVLREIEVLFLLLGVSPSPKWLTEMRLLLRQHFLVLLLIYNDKPLERLEVSTET